jgi:hypothetical protein
MAGIQVSRKKTVIGKNNRREEGACLVDQKRAEKSIHKHGTESAMSHNCIAVSIFCWQNIEKETERVEHGCLEVWDKGGA